MSTQEFISQEPANLDFGTPRVNINQAGFIQSEVNKTEELHRQARSAMDFIRHELPADTNDTNNDQVGVKQSETMQVERGDKTEKPEVVWVGTEALVSQLVHTLIGLPTDNTPHVFIDLEGVHLGRHGTISIMQIYNSAERRTYLVDVYKLGKKCFTAQGSNGQTLKTVLESNDIIKVFFDVRNDSDALFNLYGVCLNRIHDLQLMELATHAYRAYLPSLSACIEKHASLSDQERQSCMEIKNRGKKLFLPEMGGSYEVFNRRPLPQELMDYCAQDVHLLPELYDTYHMNLLDEDIINVIRFSADRVWKSWQDDYNGHGPHMCKVPKGFFYY